VGLYTSYMESWIYRYVHGILVEKIHCFHIPNALLHNYISRVTIIIMMIVRRRMNSDNDNSDDHWNKL
jgi:hypothetical protein